MNTLSMFIGHDISVQMPVQEGNARTAIELTGTREPNIHFFFDSGSQVFFVECPTGSQKFCERKKLIRSTENHGFQVTQQSSCSLVSESELFTSHLKISAFRHPRLILVDAECTLFSFMCKP